MLLAEHPSQLLWQLARSPYFLRQN